jgi:hypothetical protein
MKGTPLGRAGFNIKSTPPGPIRFGTAGSTFGQLLAKG